MNSSFRPDVSSDSQTSEPMRTLLLMHPMDPRGVKLGGIETHVRLLLERSPDDFRVLFVGVDEIGDLELGRVARLPRGDREILFLPVERVAALDINRVARSIGSSLTLRFALAILRRLREIRAALGEGPVSADVQRFEFAALPKLIGLKTVLMIHNEGGKDQKMDSLLKKLWFIQTISESVALAAADRVMCVNDGILGRLRRLKPRAAAKSEVMTVSVDQQRFAPRAFDCADDVFRIVFAGRLDAFKDPGLMFRIAAGVKARLNGRAEFHYIGASDPSRYVGSRLLGDSLIEHGYKTADEVSAILARCHAGVLTSIFEGMPCYLLETLSVGRPFAALRLPQFNPLIVPGVSGRLIERSDPDTICEAQMIDAFVGIWDGVRAGRFDPTAIAQLAAPFSVENQLGRLFARHRELQDRDRSAGDRRRAAAKA
jgi:glycosyltransferase involved in cell wall biosynthesis